MFCKRTGIVRSIITAVTFIIAVSTFTACSSFSDIYNTAMAVKGNIGASGSGKSGKLPGVFNEKSDKFSDPQMSMSKIRAAISQHVKLYKLVVYGKGPDWEVKYNSYGSIVRKITKREIYFTYKNPKDGKFYYNDCYFERQYEGGNSFGKPAVVFMTPTEIDENIAAK